VNAEAVGETYDANAGVARPVRQIPIDDARAAAAALGPRPGDEHRAVPERHDAVCARAVRVCHRVDDEGAGVREALVRRAVRVEPHDREPLGRARAAGHDDLAAARFEGHRARHALPRHGRGRRGVEGRVGGAVGVVALHVPTAARGAAVLRAHGHDLPVVLDARGIEHRGGIGGDEHEPVVVEGRVERARRPRDEQVERSRSSPRDLELDGRLADRRVVRGDERDLGRRRGGREHGGLGRDPFGEARHRDGELTREAFALDLGVDLDHASLTDERARVGGDLRLGLRVGGGPVGRRQRGGVGGRRGGVLRGRGVLGDGDRIVPDTRRERPRERSRDDEQRHRKTDLAHDFLQILQDPRSRAKCPHPITSTPPPVISPFHLAIMAALNSSKG
jgi:hypothetical protein